MKKLLQKILDEVQKDKPDLSYIRGMIETMMDMEDEPKALNIINGTSTYPQYPMTSLGVAGSNEDPAKMAVQMAEAGFVKGVAPMTTETNTILN